MRAHLNEFCPEIDPSTDYDCDCIPNGEDLDDKQPNDRDKDGIPDLYELIFGLDPDNPDTDGDGIPDGNEDYNRNGRLDPGESDPHSSDTDRDGIPDGEQDFDQDGLPDWYEDENRNGVHDSTETNF
ncbi:MAG TPA: hypothetical protein DDW81_05155, partial [Cryomorphaceae bacterium]|nr:hypothetical protein [Cryomorphaceae bacterium]